jgi:hypothetical protein
MVIPYLIMIMEEGYLITDIEHLTMIITEAMEICLIEIMETGMEAVSGWDTADKI